MREGCTVIVMLDKRRIRLMTKAAVYEKEHAEEDVKISSYYKKDYASLNTWITLIWVTVGYILAGGLAVICTADTLMEDLTIFKLIILAATAVCAYLALFIIYGIGAGKFYKKKHTRAKQRVKKYYRDLSRIEKMYEKENNRS
ncbi:hypothetical protein B5F07_00600 [Lachnoclostridium sp. An169]|uniref:hypothetical protein n=1 Tax=Lachnoclostridium sp. An169 TaxID=1965569 RepID=UPI000B364DAA|nr:hypothetical protein [Lachnoclostridium sp. An169]OUP86524.1 hypothetical protein B5F07_00600 [Lachnoclostridium sp. An169]